VFRNVLVVLS